MIEVSIALQNDIGLHARPAALFVATASQFLSSIWVRKAGSDAWVDAKSILSILMLGIESGQAIEIRVDGSDELEAVSALTELVEHNFPTENHG